MRTETLWQGERRAARLHWWFEVLDRPAGFEDEKMFDEVLSLRFHFSTDPEQTGPRAV